MKIFVKGVRRFFYILSFFLLRPLWRVLPFRLSLELANLVSSLTASLYQKRRLIAKRNLRHIPEFSEEQLRNVLDEGVKNISLFGFLDFFMERWTPELCQQYVIMEGQENLLEAIQQKKGVLIAFVHSNNFNAVFPCVGTIEKVHVIVVLESSHGITLSNVHAKIRERFWKSTDYLDYIFLNRGESVSLKVRSMLREGKIVAISADGLHTGKFLPVPFFGKKIQLPTGIFKLSTLLGVPILPLFSGFDGKKSVFRVWLGDPILSRTPEEAAEAFIDQFQQHLRKYPSHWTGWWRMKLIKDEKGDEVFQIHSI